MILDLTEQITRAQIAFGVAAIAFLLAWIAFVRTPGGDSKHRKSDGKK